MNGQRQLAIVTSVSLLVLIGPTSLMSSSAGMAAQQAPTPPRDTREPQQEVPAGTASIVGTVVVADSKQPARKTRVNLSGSELRGGRSVTTDSLGRFAFANLPAGRFTLSASKPGHVNVSYGQRRPGAGRPGTPIQLEDGQKVEVQLQMPRGGVITGVLLDEQGEAIPGTQVRVLRYAMQSGVRTLQMAGSGSTDDRGIYRIYGLQPGEYVVAATPRNPGNADAEMRMREELTAMASRMETVAATDPVQARELAQRMATLQGQVSATSTEEPTTGYAPVYYPGTTSAAAAQSVIVGLSEERQGVDFQLQLVSVARIEGVVVTSTAQAAQNVQVTLINIGQEVAGIGNTTARPDNEGRFRFSNIAPGQYLLVARGTLGGPAGRGGRGAAMPELEAAARARGAPAPQGPEPARLWAMSEISVDGRTVSNLVLTLQPGMSVSGRIAFDGTTLQQPADLTRLRVTANPMDVGGVREVASPASGRVDASGRFMINGVVPGRYRLSASGAGTGWTLASSIVDSQDTLDVPIEVKPNQSVVGAVITFTDRQTELSGAIVNDKGQSVPDYSIIVYPSDRDYWRPQSRRIVSTRPATDGRFLFRNLPPGEYRIAPVLDPEPGAWFDPAFLQQLDSTALSVSLNEGEKKVQNLRVGSI
jgi:hypothetical protein